MSNFKLIEPASLNDYAPILKDVKFGEVIEDQIEFLTACAMYVGVLEPRLNVNQVVKEIGGPDIWEQRIAYIDGNYPLDPIGITGWYIHPPYNLKRIWLGWFGVTCKGVGFGTRLLTQTTAEIKRLYPDMEWLYVFTDNAAKFYEKNGFERLGSVKELMELGHIGIDENTTFKISEIILRKSLKE